MKVKDLHKLLYTPVVFRDQYGIIEQLMLIYEIELLAKKQIAAKYLYGDRVVRHYPPDELNLLEDSTVNIIPAKKLTSEQHRNFFRNVFLNLG